MKNEFKSGYTYITKDDRLLLCLSILNTMMLMQSEDGATLGYQLDGTTMMVKGADGTHSEHLDLVPGLFSKQDALKEMKLGKRVQSAEWLDENGGKYWFYKKNNLGHIVNEVGDVVTDEFDELSDDICWQICDSFMEPEALENLVTENKNMAEFLESIGYSQDKIFNIAFCGEKPKSEIELLKEEVTEMEKDGMANANAIERFNRKIESLQNADITEEAMKKIKDSCRLASIGFFHAEYSNNLSTDKLLERAKKGQLQVCEAYEYFNTDSLFNEIMSLESLIFSNIEYALSSIKGEPQLSTTEQAPNTLSLYKTSVQELSGDVIAMLDGYADYVCTGLDRGSMIFDLDTLREILNSYIENASDEDENIESDTLYKEFSFLVKLVSLNGCKGLFLTNGKNHE